MIKVINKKVYNASFWHILFFSLVLIVFLSSIYYYFHFKQSSMSGKSSYQQAVAKNQQYAQDLNTVYEQLPVFLNAKKKGFLGESLRVDWVQTVDMLAKKHSLPQVDFNLRNNHYMEQDNFLYWKEDVRVYSADMNVSFKLLHELDFYNFFNDLQSVAKGMADIKECKMSYKDEGNDELAMLIGSCTVRWFSVANDLQHWGSL